MSSKYIPGSGFDDRNTKDVSPRKDVASSASTGQSNDSQWNKFLSSAND